jgi:phenylalanyl-tRNA synthetase alpha chain
MESLLLAFKETLETVDSLDALERLKIRYLGKNGVLKKFKNDTDFKVLSPDERKGFGLAFNQAKSQMGTLLEEARKALTQQSKVVKTDLTLPGKKRNKGRFHPIARVQNKLEEICLGMGFMVPSGVDMESDC